MITCRFSPYQFLSYFLSAGVSTCCLAPKTAHHPNNHHREQSTAAFSDHDSDIILGGSLRSGGLSKPPPPRTDETLSVAATGIGDAQCLETCFAITNHHHHPLFDSHLIRRIGSSFCDCPLLECLRRWAGDHYSFLIPSFPFFSSLVLDENGQDGFASRSPEQLR